VVKPIRTEGALIGVVRDRQRLRERKIGSRSLQELMFNVYGLTYK